MTNRDLLELIASQVNKLTTQLGALTNDVAEIKADIKSIKEIVIKIESDHGQKLGALLDGYKHN